MDELDPTLDFAMIEYLRTIQVSNEYEPIDVEALKLRADLYYLKNHRLREKISQRVVPTISERKILLH